MFKENIPLSKYTTLKVGGPASYFTSVTNDDELVSAVQFAKQKNLPITVLGGGSNVLVADAGISGLVIKNDIIGIETSVEGEYVLLTAGAGEVFDSLILHTVENGYWGLENLSHIPGSVGATPVQNVGAYGREVSDCIVKVRVYNVETEMFEELRSDDCHFGYRDSLFKTTDGKKYVVVSVTYTLSATPRPNIRYKDLANYFKDTENPTLEEIRNAVISIRSKKFPDWQKVGTAGSFFKNPIISEKDFEILQSRYPDIPGFPLPNGDVKVPLGWILDKVCHVRGLSIGNVGTYEGQALVVVHNGNADASEIENFANEIMARVHEATGITIEWEVTLLK